jgi:YidC/Oxa1 family membrane protein insertase
MEKRAILAAFLMAALLVVYQVLFVKPPEPKAPTGSPTAEKPPIERKVEPPTPLPAVPSKQAAPIEARRATIETPLYRAVVDSKGGGFDVWDLHYRGEKLMVLPGVVSSPGLTVVRPGQPAQPINFSFANDAITLGKDRDAAELRMEGEDGFGLHVMQVLRFRVDSYAVGRQITVENKHDVPQSVDVLLSWSGPAVWPKDHEEFSGARPIHIVRLTKGALWPRREYLAKAEPYVGEGRWIGFESGVAPTGQNGVYLTAIIPTSAGFMVTEASREESVGNGPKAVVAAEVGVRATLPTLKPGESWTGSVETYLGPMEYERLKARGVGLEKAIYFGGFPFPESWAAKYGMPALPMEWIVVPTLSLMRWFHSYVPNYGVAIILLTVMTRVLFFPLTIKSMSSMRAMQALQPQVNAIRSKYKSDPQRLQQETMALYRTHKVNPLGGCLPMIVQVPIFYALYDALSVSVDLQNAPFICFGRVFGVDVWICDLAKHDPTYVLPLLMGASMFVQQKMTPVMGDPRQAKMMLFMPVVFTFMFLNLPAGLVLYWTLSNVFQIAQQKYMQRTAKVEKAPARAPKKA